MNAILEPIIFYIFSAALILSAALVIFLKNPVHAALQLVLAFFASAVLWILLQAEFLALILILVYVGAVMTLFLFVVMMLDVERAAMQRAYVKYMPLGLLVIAALVALLIYAFGAYHPAMSIAPAADQAALSNTQQLGAVLYTQYAYPFELAAILLLIAIIAAISLAFRGRRGDNRNPVVEQQLQVQRHERIRLVDMPAVTKTQNSTDIQEQEKKDAE